MKLTKKVIEPTLRELAGEKYREFISRVIL